jgi:hypothetical protein
MSDLSQLLGDLYADDAPVAKAPEWSSDEALDDAFASWVPGPADGAAAAERSIVEHALDVEPVAAPPMEDEDWMRESAPAPAMQPVEVPEHVEPFAPLSPLAWSPSDDDILPSRGIRARGRHSKQRSVKMPSLRRR